MKLYKERQFSPTLMVCVGEFNPTEGKITFATPQSKPKTTEATGSYRGWFVKDEQGNYKEVFPNTVHISEVVIKQSTWEDEVYELGFIANSGNLVLYDEFM